MTRRLARALAALALAAASASTVRAADPLPPAAARLQSYLRIDTSNPPGNEQPAANFLKRILEADGIAVETFEAAPGRTNLVARLHGREPGPGLLLHHHMDVVPPGPGGWFRGPFSGDLVDGHLVGRGALDDKSLGIAELEAFLALKRSGRLPVHDVVFLATADEEAGGARGVAAIAKARPLWLAGLGAGIGEGGSTETIGGVQRYFGIEVAQKPAVWVKLRARGTPGHAAAPEDEPAGNRLARALAALASWRRTPVLDPVVERGLRAAASVRGPDEEARIAALAGLLRTNPALALDGLRPRVRNLLTDTISTTRLGSDSVSTNALASEAWAEVDCRLAPGTDAAAFLEELKARVRESGVTVEALLVAPAGPDAPEGDFFRLVAGALRSRFPGVVVGAEVSTGLSENRVLRSLGIATYGLTPFAVFPLELRGIHGAPEKIRVDRFLDGVAVLREIVNRFAFPPRPSPEPPRRD